MTALRPCLGFQTAGEPRHRCPEYALPGESRCEACKALFEAWRRTQPHLTGRRGTSSEWRRLRGLAIHRARHRCQRCGKHEERSGLEVHHVDGDSENNRLSNLRALCPDCHKIEQKETDERARKPRPRVGPLDDVRGI
jgi:5-methylcytosine-specific restriction endonuclease McrA